ncbi:MAG TPA: LysM peptidoglycan-binding domain-containing protein [Bacteroidales bacterium]|nr:MAG: Membrane-bound lytic murein transglycosylase D precursor [Bacteroidetes bacterium ADurb.Bin139]HOR11336.1 LysM peptidoglycan-binding domain-containing protein [Bacteroidales bacterium]HOZ19089.1 LysM peptidoglycan-binding domain-containing protein [Bacteroidales bacterium]HPB77173.1 LysM peptidoglycan-binding domain-containing protein [Bacteroidales bacterium]HPK38937.1 LysM peptidoglycan-binding domain-containing protein [Bacteroidales bacterium]
MKSKCFILSILLVTLTVTASSGQVMRRPTKKQLTQQVDSLLKLTDSLQQALMEYELPAADSLLLENEINEGDFNNPETNPDFDYDSLSTDQRLSLYYHQNQLNRMPDALTLETLDTALLTSTIPDSVYINRLTRMNSFIKLPYNNIVRNHIIHYTQKMPDRIPTILGLAQYYMPLFEEILDSYKMPLELKAMAVIESALNPRAVSRARATGMWQFMYRTALNYNLTINSYVDERLDPIVSGDAAARYLLDSYRIYGDWILAIASYNCGVGNVNKAIRRAGGSREFWDIYPFLPRETRGYVPAFVAALYTMRYYAEHQIRPLPIEMPAHVDTFEVNKMLHFEQITSFLNISTDQLRDLNPQYVKDIIPGVERPYILRLPFECSGDFAALQDSIYSYKDSVYFNPLIMNTRATASDTQITHRVRSGETLSHIAYRYGVRIADVKYWNGLRSDRIVPNQRLIIYTRGTGAPRSETASAAGSSAAPARPRGNLITHKVQKGETLGGIAEKYKVSAANLRSWNNIRNNTIYAGSTLKIYTSATATTSQDGSFEYYTVKSGDNLWDIANKLGITVQNIRSLNGLGSNSRIYPGQKLKIRKI